MVHLAPLAFRPLPLGSIAPAGWLANQLRIQADGLSGHLDEFWPDIRDSAWIGGPAEGWERVPYWLDGVVPLAWLLNDERLKAKARRYIDHILDHQQPDGWLGPVMDNQQGRRAYDPWPRFVLLKVLVQYHETNADARVLDAMERFLRFLDDLLDREPLQSWGRARWQDLVWCIHWLQERRPGQWLLELGNKARRQGLDWRGNFENFRYDYKIDHPTLQKLKQEQGDDVYYATHVVNNAQAIKASGVAYRQTHDPADRAAVYTMIETLDRQHGQVTGVFSGDEHLATRHPSQGTELCAVNEYLFSLEVLASILGDAALGDRMEKITFNALPATFAPDMWSHQYDQQANQIHCGVFDDRIYTNNNADANVFGLEPNFGCCTANMHQGWPKFTAHLWMASADDGLAAVAYAPCEVRTRVGGVDVGVKVETEYPFEEKIRIIVRTEKASRFPLHLRVPGWAEGATLRIEDEPAQKLRAGRFHRLDRDWRGVTALELNLPMRVRVERRFNGAAAVHRGLLVYSVAIPEQWVQLKGELPHADWEVRPTGAWNWGLEIDEKDPARSLRFERRPVGSRPFSPEGAPCVLHVPGRRVENWGVVKNAADAPPAHAQAAGPSIELALIPYGCTNLRMTEMPLLGG